MLGAKDSAEAYANQMYEYMLASERYQQFQEVTFLDIFDLETIRNFNGTLWWESVSHEGLPDRQAVATLLESIVSIFVEMGFLTFLMTLLTACYFIRKWQTRRIKFYYQPSQQMYKDLLKHTDLASMKYQPHLFTLNGHVQGAVYFAFELFYQMFNPIKYSREIFELYDGGQIGLDWLIHPSDDQENDDDRTFTSTKKNEQKRPLLVFVPGMSGTSQQMYSCNLA